jgi:GNAT superfamily N-acetyltransferase
VSEIELPASLDLLDVAGNGAACERYLWIRGLSDRELTPKARIDLIDDLQRIPGELLHLTSTNGSLAATTVIVRDGAGGGSCYLSVFTRNDPGEPLLGDVVQLACERARAGGIDDVRCIDGVERPHIIALQERHGFRAHDQWRRFHLDIARDAVDGPELPVGMQASTLAERGDLATDAYRVLREALEETTGAGPRPDETLDTWLRDTDGSPVRSRALVLVLHIDNDVRAVAELERVAMGSDHGWLDMLAVDRAYRGTGIGALAKQHAEALASRSGLRRLQTMNHAGNDVICRLNERLGWIEDPVRIELRLPI